MEEDKDIIKTDISLFTSEFEEAIVTQGNETERENTGINKRIATYSATNMQNEHIFLGGMKEGEKEEGKGEPSPVELEEVEEGSPNEGNGDSLYSERNPQVLVDDADIHLSEKDKSPQEEEVVRILSDLEQSPETSESKEQKNEETSEGATKIDAIIDDPEKETKEQPNMLIEEDNENDKYMQELLIKEKQMKEFKAKMSEERKNKMNKFQTYTGKSYRAQTVHVNLDEEEGMDERTIYMRKLRDDFWTQFEILENKYWLSSMITLPIVWMATLLLPVYLVEDCKKGHNIMAHLIEGIVAAALVIIHSSLGVKFISLVEKATPAFEKLDDQRFNTISNKLKKNKYTKFIFFEVLTILSYYDMYTDICFVTIARASDDEYIWLIAACVMAFTSLPRLYSYIKYFILYFKHRNPTKEESMCEDNFRKDHLTNQRLKTRLFSLYDFLTAQELKGFSEPLRGFARDHKIFHREELKADKKEHVKCLAWKTMTEDVPQLCCQFAYILTVTELCEGTEEANPIIYISMLVSGFMSITFTLLAIHGVMKKQIFKMAFRDAFYLMSFDNTLDQLTLEKLIDDKISIDDAIVGVSNQLPSIKSLHKLHLDDMKIGNKGAAALGAAIAQSPHITEITLKGNQIDNTGAECIRKGMESNINLTYIDLERNSIEPKGLTKLVNFNQKELQLGNEDSTYIFDKTCSDAYSVFECLKRWNKPALAKLELWLSTPEDFKYEGDTLGLLISESLSNLMQNASNLEYVDMSDQGDDRLMYGEMSKVLELLGKAKNLNYLEITGVPFTETDMSALSCGLTSNNSISKLILNENNINEEGIHELCPGIVNNTSIKTLKIYHNAFGDSIPAAKDLADAVNVNKSLEQLNLAHNGMSDEGAKIIKEGIVESKNDNFMKATINDEEVKIYPMIIKDNLTILELNQVDNVDEENELDCSENEGLFKIILGYVEGNMIIEKLNLKGIKFTPKQLGLLCRALSQKKNLEFLNLSEIVQEKGLRKFCEHIGGMLKDTASIQTLIFSNNVIENDVTFILEGLTLNHTLLYLNINNCGITAVGGKDIGEYLGNNPQLHKLDMRTNWMEVNGAGHIGEGLSQNSTLLHLDLSENAITREGAENLAKGLAKNNTLVTLNLGANEFGDKGMVATSEALCAGGLKSSLVTLIISSMGLGEEGIEAVGELLKVGEKLEMVDLGLYRDLEGDIQGEGNSISDKAAQYLSEGIQHNKSRSLKHLNLEVEAKESQRLSDEKAVLIEQAIKSHLGIEKIILDGWNIPQERKDYILEILERRLHTKY